MNLILIERGELADGRVRLTGGRASHIRGVLRTPTGGTVRLGVIDGPTGEGTVLSCDATGVVLDCRLDGPVPLRPRVDLLLAVPRPKVLNRLWAQLAAIGVGRIMLTNAEKVERMYFDTHVLGEAHRRTRLIEGLAQAKDTRVPEVTVHRRFKVLIEDELDALCGEAARVVADASFGDQPSAAIPTGSGRVVVAVGPEGGWTPYELDLLTGHGFRGFGLGPRTLRADTACVAVLTLVHERLACAGVPAGNSPSRVDS